MNKMKLASLLMVSVFVITPQFSNVHAMPSQQVSGNTWKVWGKTDLEAEKRLAVGRNLPQGLVNVLKIIDQCIREGRELKVHQQFGINTFTYNLW